MMLYIISACKDRTVSDRRYTLGKAPVMTGAVLLHLQHASWLEWRLSYDAVHHQCLQTHNSIWQKVHIEQVCSCDWCIAPSASACMLA